MQQIFRFFRGELNGFLINNLCTFLNRYIKSEGLLDEIVYQAKFQWKLPYETTADKLAMRQEDILGLGLIGGLFQLRTVGNTSLGSVWFTPSVVINNKQRNERGLIDMDYESFVYVHVNYDDYPTPISELANENRRITYREKGAVPLGFLPEGTPIFDAAGDVIWANMLSTPPTDRAYIEWYGFKYLYYENFLDAELPLTIDSFMLLFQALQRIRRRGVSIVSLLELTSYLCETYVHDIDIRFNGRGYVCTYSLDIELKMFNRERRYAAWLHVVKSKFKLFTFVDRAITAP